MITTGVIDVDSFLVVYNTVGSPRWGAKPVDHRPYSHTYMYVQIQTGLS